MTTFLFFAIVACAAAILYTKSLSEKNKSQKPKRTYIVIPSRPRGLVSCTNELTVKDLDDQIDSKTKEYEALDKTITDRGDAETDEESEKLENLLTEIENLRAQKKRMLRNQRLNGSGRNLTNALGGQGSSVQNDDEKEGKVEVKGPAFLNDESGQLGFNSFGNYLTAIQDHAVGNNTDFNEQILFMQSGENHFDAEVGYSVPRGFLNQGCDPCHTPDDESSGGMFRGTQEMNQLLMLDGGQEDMLYRALNTSNLAMTRPDIKVPYMRDKDHRHGMFGGVYVTDKADQDCFTQLSKLNFGKLRLEVGPTYAMACFHNTLLRDSQISLVQLFRSGVSRALRFDAIEKILYGNSSGTHQGMFPDADPTKNPALIRVGRKNVGGAIHLDDLLSMRKHCYGYGGSQWWGSLDTFVQLFKLSLAAVAGGGAPIFTFNFNTGEGVLLGRPIYFTDEFVDCGGLYLFNAQHYLTSNFQGPEWASSAHVMWLCDKNLFRVATRTASANWWECPLIPRRCNSPKSPFICLGDSWHVPECPEFDPREYMINSGYSGTFSTTNANGVAVKSAVASTELKGKQATSGVDGDLSKLSLAQLKSAAKKMQLNTEACKNKKDFIAAIEAAKPSEPSE